MISLLIALTISLPSHGACGDSEAIGRIVEIDMVEDQPVEVRRFGESSWGSEEEGSTICSGDEVRTRFRTRTRVRLASASGGVVDVVLGVNTRIMTTGVWTPSDRVDADPPVIDIVHGVVRLGAEADSARDPNHIRSGPVLCRFRKAELLSNWDPFKREANHIVVSGRASCAIEEATEARTGRGEEEASVDLEAGQHLEVVRGELQTVRAPSPLILDAFRRATRLE